MVAMVIGMVTIQHFGPLMGRYDNNRQDFSPLLGNNDDMVRIQPLTGQRREMGFERRYCVFVLISHVRGLDGKQ
jgi:hypothetical protein